MKQGFVRPFVMLFYLHSPCFVLVVYSLFLVSVSKMSVRLCASLILLSTGTPINAFES